MHYVNGQYVDKADAKISIYDLSILRGFGVFDYLRTYNKKPFHLWDHLLRLKYSAEHIGLNLPNSLEEIETIVHTLLDATPLPEAGIKIIVTGGVSPDQITPQTPTLIAFTCPIAVYPASHFTHGVKVITTTLSRSLPSSKTIQYTPGIVAMQRAKDQRPHEVLYLNPQNEILEASTCNFFAFKNDTLYTCASDEILLGITREVVLKLAAPHFPIQFKSLHSSDIPAFEEAFLTSSTREVMPIAQIDSHPIPVGPKTQLLRDLFKNYTSQHPWPPINIPRYNSTISMDIHSPIC